MSEYDEGFRQGVSDARSGLAFDVSGGYGSSEYEEGYEEGYDDGSDGELLTAEDLL